MVLVLAFSFLRSGLRLVVKNACSKREIALFSVCENTTCYGTSNSRIWSTISVGFHISFALFNEVLQEVNTIMKAIYAKEGGFMTRFCTNCGAPLSDGADFCTSCGAPIGGRTENGQASGAGSTQAIPVAPSAQSGFSQAPGQPPAIQTPVIQTPVIGQAPQKAQKSNTTLLIGIVVALVVILAAVLVGVFVFGEQESSPAQSPASSSSSSSSASYKVTFETNGGSSVSQATVDEGSTLSTPQSPTRAGYTFDGWYLDSALSKKASFPLKVDSNMTLYAKWESSKDASEVSISIVGRDGSTRTATIHRDGQTGRVFPNSNNTALSESQVRALSDAERCVAWNEIIAAANGYEFKNSGLRSYFNDYCSWYTPSASSNGTGNLSTTASKNIDLLKRYTDNWWLNLATY